MERKEWEVGEFKKEMECYSTDGTFVCPYCGYKYEFDHTEDVPHDDLEWSIEFDCPHCGKTYFAEQRVSFSYQTYKCKEETD